MASARRGKKATKVKRVDAEVKRAFPSDAKTHRRLLRFVNGARTPEDLAYAPLNEIKAEPQETLKRPDVDEPMQERHREKLIDLNQARRILEARDKLSPLY